jgi:tetratricopeptide (TPR) repeat protein
MKRIELFKLPRVIPEPLDLKEISAWHIAFLGYVSMKGTVTDRKVVEEFFGHSSGDPKELKGVKTRLSRAKSVGVKCDLITETDDEFQLNQNVSCDALELIELLNSKKHHDVRTMFRQPPLYFCGKSNTSPWVENQEYVFSKEILDSRLEMLRTAIKRRKRDYATDLLNEAHSFLDYLETNVKPHLAIKLGLNQARVRLESAQKDLAALELIQEPQIVKSDPEVIGLLNRARSLFEKGKFVESLSRCDEALASNINLEDRIQCLAVIAWVKLFTFPVSEATEAVQAMNVYLEGGEELSQKAEALIWLQNGRLYNRIREFELAKSSFLKAQNLLEDVPQSELEQGSVLAGLGYIAQNKDDLDTAQNLYQQAIHHFSRTQWHWGIQVQYSNLAAISCLRYEMEFHRNPAAAEAHLRDAQRYCKDGKAFLDDVGIGGLTDLETTLSYIYRMLKDFKQAQYWVDVAMALAVNSDSLAEIGLVWLNKIKKHLKLLKSNLQDLTPLKLW